MTHESVSIRRICTNCPWTNCRRGKCKFLRIKLTVLRISVLVCWAEAELAVCASVSSQTTGIYSVLSYGKNVLQELQISKEADPVEDRGEVEQVGHSISLNRSLVNKLLHCLSVVFWPTGVIVISLGL